MKNLVIQTLETRGVLGQIRAKLRSSVFKIVDEQDQRLSQPMGCGLKWENPLIYKIKDTNVGGLIAELMREFMEYLKMDYSLSVFIPECSISPERLKRDEIYARLGLNIANSNPELPLLYFILYHFIESVNTNPQKVFETLNNPYVEKNSDELIMKNYYNYQANNIADNDEIQNLAPAEERKEKHSEKNSNQNFDVNTFEKITEVDLKKGKKSFEYEDVIAN